MTIHCLLFSIFRENVGQKKVTLDLPQGATVREAFDALCAAQAACPRDLLPTTMFAVGHAYVPLDHVLADGDELALIPPVAGG